MINELEICNSCENRYYCLTRERKCSSPFQYSEWTQQFCEDFFVDTDENE